MDMPDNFGPNVQALIDAGALPVGAARSLTPEQTAAIESWNHGTIQLLIELYNQTGAIAAAFWI